MSRKAVKIFAEGSNLMSSVSLLFTKPGLLCSPRSNLGPWSLDCLYKLLLSIISAYKLFALPSCFLDNKMKLPGL